MRNPQAYFTFELRSLQGSCVWHLSMSDGRGVLGAAPNADEAARDACASLLESEPGSHVVGIVPMLLESALTWSGALERFARTVPASR